MSFKSSVTIPAVAAISFCLIGGTTPAAADILHVPGDYPTIQAAIDAAVDGDEVEVHPGTYFETINFLGKPIRVYSTDGPDVTIIDAQQTGSVVTCDSGEGSDTVLDGFTMTGGTGTDLFGTGVLFGGGMINEGSSPTVTNCTFSGNTATSGGGMLNSGGSPTVTNCTFNENSMAISGGGMFNVNAPGSPMVTNCIFWGDSPDEISGAGMVTVSYSDVQGGFVGMGNIDADPMFVAPGIGDYRLSSGSPAIDAGNNWGVLIDVNDYDEDSVLCELFPVDLDGNPRFNADEADFDPGCGVPVVVDMGAYEYQFDPVDQVTFADLNGDDAVGVADLLGLLASWGPCAKGCCLADLDIDGDVGISDLLALLANWGPCP